MNKIALFLKFTGSHSTNFQVTTITNKITKPENSVAPVIYFRIRIDKE